MRSGRASGKGPRVLSMKASFNCPHCDAPYHVVRGEPGPETLYRKIACRACGGPLPEREGEFVLKYFLLRKAHPA
jgi:hypothetical protein